MNQSATILQYREAPVIMTEHAVRISEAQLTKHHILAHRSQSREADLFRMLRTQVLSIMAEHGLRTIGITSPKQGEGKTTVALNLAMSIALDLKQTVLLAELDLRKPDIASYLGLPATKGLSDYLTTGTPLSDCMVRPSVDRLMLLPAGKPMERSSEILGSPKMAALANEMKHRYADRLVIYDLPPVLTQDDPLVFLPHIDGLLMVINQGLTSVDEMNTALQRTENTRLVGTVLNHAPEKR